MLCLLEKLTLASASPRRRQLFERLGLHLALVAPHADAEPDSAPTLVERAVDNALAKYRNVQAGLDGWVLSADTVVGLHGQGRQTILGKPADSADAHAMLRRLSGRTQQVVTAYCIGVGGEVHPRVQRHVLSRVTFRQLSDAEIAAYVADGEPLDKAGSYGIQGQGRAFISEVEGSYTNVMGLPIVEVLADLVDLGVVGF